MKRFLMVAVFAVGAIGFNTEVSARVSINVGQPGFYGSIDVGGHPQPQLIYREPKVIGYVSHNQQPMYMRVPRKHHRNWRRHCGYYNACHQRVYFVQNNWYQREYAPRYRAEHGQSNYQQPRGNSAEHRNDNNRGHGHGHGHGRGHHR